jgi:hypothetical protein
MEFTNCEFVLPDNLSGRSLQSHVIPTVCNVKNMLSSLVAAHGDITKLKQWEKQSYNHYLCDEIMSEFLTAEPNCWKYIIRSHILSHRASDFGANVIDIYLVAYVAHTYGIGKDVFFNYIKSSGISQQPNSAQAIWQVGKGDGVYLGILNDDGTVKDWGFMYKWVHHDDLRN